MIRAPVWLAAVVAVFPATAGIVKAQDEPPAVVSVVLRPAAAPVPALKYALLPERSSLVPGNAVLFYHRAIEWILGDRARHQPVPDKQKRRAADSDEQAAYEWVNGPIAAIPLDRARAWLDQRQFVLHEAELGARRRDCDWGFGSRSEGYNLIITEIQEMRSLVRVVALRARVAILEKKPDEAIYWLQTGFAMARHVSQGPTLIQPLVGLASSAILNHALEDLIQSPGMPSLYWALANRPRPLIDLAPALEGERFLLERQFPQLLELDGLSWSVEKARDFSTNFEAEFYRISGMQYKVPARPGSPAKNMSLGDWAMKPALIMQAYPEAKRALIAQGRPAAVVEAIPTVQVVALYTFQSYQAFRDDVFKWAGLPYYRAYEGMSASWRGHSEELQRRPLLKLFVAFLPSLQSAYLAAVRVDRQLVALQCIEAIRIHAATHQGFPRRLDEITEAPVPIDPATGQPFGYRVDGDHATLTAPYPPGAPRVPPFAIHYELKLARGSGGWPADRRPPHSPGPTLVRSPRRARVLGFPDSKFKIQ
jgi:hypothetical protein